MSGVLIGEVVEVVSAVPIAGSTREFPVLPEDVGRRGVVVDVVDSSPPVFVVRFRRRDAEREYREALVDEIRSWSVRRAPEIW